MSSDRTRYAVRALILSETNEVLLLRMKHPEQQGYFWLMPGGGVKANEDSVVALRREVWEETGMKSFDSPTLIWRRTHRFERGTTGSGTPVVQHESIYLVNCQRFDPTADNNSDPSQVGVFCEFRWWTVEALSSATYELFAPRSLPQLVDKLIEEGAPSTPIMLDD